MCLQLLEDNWDIISNKVVEPLWRSEFKVMYESVKMDEYDFKSLAGYALTQAFSTYNPEKSNIITFAANVLKRKAKTEIRDKLRKKRIADTYAESLYAKMSEENDETLESVLESTASKEDSYCCDVEEVKKAVFKLLRPKEIKIIELTLLGFNDKTIAETLKMSTKDVLGIKKRISESSAVTRVFRMSGYLGGDEE